jgi:hydrogenase expression/formation protein HypC
MKITQTDGFSARVEVEGTSTNANVSLIENPAVGDYVIIHAGFAIEKLDETEAEIRIELFNEIGITENALPSQ